MKRFFFLTITFLLTAFASLKAQRFSYVYIQGDKQTPFYVKLDGAMQPRYGKNYCILPQLEAGTIRLEVLFQQNAFPAEQFTILVPESGSRAFMLTKREGVYALYDLQQQFDLSPGNDAADDHLPAVLQAAQTAPPVAELTPEPEPEKVADVPVVKQEQARVTEPAIVTVKEKEPKKPRPARQPVVKDTATDSGPEFLDVTLANAHNDPLVQQQQNIPAPTDTVFTRIKPLAATFRNSDCPQPLPDKDFERIYKAMMQQAADEDRVSYLNGQLDNCYQTWQARTLGTMLSEDAARYTFLKNVYPHITDQQAFPLLDDMLRSEVWKAQFIQLTHH